MTENPKGRNHGSDAPLTLNLGPLGYEPKPQRIQKLILYNRLRGKPLILRKFHGCIGVHSATFGSKLGAKLAFAC